MSSFDKVVGSISETSNTGEFEWRINNCSEKVFAVETGEYLSSPTFSFSYCSWYVRMYPNGYDSSRSRKEWISIRLHKEEKLPEKCVSYILVMSFLGEQLEKTSETSLFEKSKSDWGWNQFILRKKVLDLWSVFDKKTKTCSLLTIKISLRVFHDEDALLKVRPKDIEILCQNFKDLLLHGKDHDLVVKVKDKEFKAHRSIMQCRCPIFNNMLTHEMLEKRSGVIEIPDCDPFAFEQFLIYVYTGDLDILDGKNMLGLYYIADKYDMVFLKEKCTEFIKKSLSTDNICDVIRLALNHSNSSLLEFAKEYFVKNVKGILVTVEWQSFVKENPIQANELFIKTINDCPLHLPAEINEMPTE